MSQRRRSSVAALVMAAVAALGLMTATAGASTAGAQTASSTAAATPSMVTIEQVTSATQGPCLPAAFALSRTVISTLDVFRLHIVVSAPLCEPIQAAAVVYGMPGGGFAWDQTLLERTNFTISAAGTIDVTFHKTCHPAQFDVITGDSPTIIGPLGPWHGPLLFPFDTETAQQWWGYPCAAPASADVQIAKTVETPDGTGPGAVVVYHLVVTGNGPDTATNVRVVDAPIVNRATVTSDTSDPVGTNNAGAAEFVGTPLVRPLSALVVGAPLIAIVALVRRCRSRRA